MTDRKPTPTDAKLALPRNLGGILVIALSGVLFGCDAEPPVGTPTVSAQVFEQIGGDGDEPEGPVFRAPAECDPSLECDAAPTCVGIRLFPTPCGDDNCDEPIGFCEPAPECDPALECDPTPTCVNGGLYPTGCGPDNCDHPCGACSADDDG